MFSFPPVSPSLLNEFRIKVRKRNRNEEQRWVWGHIMYRNVGGFWGSVRESEVYLCINPLNAELNPICHLLALFGAYHIFHVSGLRVKLLNRTAWFETSFNFQSLLVTWCTNSLTFKDCTLCPHCIYVFCIFRRTNSDLCHLQHKLIAFYNPDEKCLQRGTDWVFK